MEKHSCWNTHIYIQYFYDCLFVCIKELISVLRNVSRTFYDRFGTGQTGFSRKIVALYKQTYFTRFLAFFIGHRSDTEFYCDPLM